MQIGKVRYRHTVQRRRQAEQRHVHPLHDRSKRLHPRSIGRERPRTAARAQQRPPQPGPPRPFFLSLVFNSIGLNKSAPSPILYLERGKSVPDAAEPELLERARSGNRAAFDALQKALETPVRRFTRRLIGQSEAEDDITRGVFLALYRNLDKLTPPDRLRPFIFRVVRNLCYDELRRLGRFELVSLDDESGDAPSPVKFLPDHRPQPDEAAHWAFIYSEVQEAMNGLPEIQRQTLILYCEEDLTYAQIAEVTAADIGTVKSRIHHARKNLAARLRLEIREAIGL